MIEGLKEIAALSFFLSLSPSLTDFDGVISFVSDPPALPRVAK